MVEKQPTRIETSDAPRMEYLLGALRGLSQQDPPPALRYRLKLLLYQRLRGGVEPGRRLGSPRAGLRSWLMPAFAAALLIVIGSLAVLVVHIRRSQRLQAGIELRLAPPEESSSIGTAARSAFPVEEIKSLRTMHASPRVAQNTTARRM